MPTRLSSLRYVIPNAISSANIAAGFGSMLAAAADRFELAVYLLVLAVVLDMLDGLTARKLNATSCFGQQMDSLSDALSFGAAPAFLAFRALLEPLGGWGIAVSVTYLLAAVFRLARFNLTTDAHVKDERTIGVPTPIGAGYVMAMVLMRDELQPVVAATVTVTFAVLMVSRLRLPNLKGRNAITAMLLVGICNYLVVVAHPTWTTVGWWNAWNLIILLAARTHDRRLESAGSFAEQ